VSVSKTLVTPSASPSATIALASSPGLVPVDFNYPVTRVDYRVDNGPLNILRLERPELVANLDVPADKGAGSLQVVAAPLSWEEVGRLPTNISWFVPPASGAPVALVDPAPGSATATADAPITLIFDEPIAKLFGSSRPALSPRVAGTWSQPDSNTLIFTPSGFGFGPGATVTVSFKQPIATISAVSGDATTAATTSEHYTFEVAPGSILRMEQILAQLHYLPLNFVPAAGVTEPTDFQGEVAAMSSPLRGKLSWRWFSTPEALQQQWSPGAPDAMLKGALMSFEADQESNSYDGYQEVDETVGQLADASTWDELLHAAASDQVDSNPYSYVYVSENLPETLTLWENGSVVLTTPANTGIPVDPTALGTYPIYVRFTSNWMNGTNPDGTKYHDMVYWINYFNGSDAVHGFYRASYGFPQSLGCVELPISTAKVAFGYLSIGDLVTVAA
jgi:lipoprotein-anchoring transpeptidase ErfK/SrfK